MIIVYKKPYNIAMNFINKKWAINPLDLDGRSCNVCKNFRKLFTETMHCKKKLKNVSYSKLRFIAGKTRIL